MTDQKISQSSVLTPLSGAELVPLAIANVGNYRTTVNSLRGIGIGKTMSSAYSPTITNPSSGMSFNMQRILRPSIGPFSPALQTFEDDCVQDCGFYTRSGNTGTWSFANGRLSLSSTADSFGNSMNVFGYETFEFPGFAVALEGIGVTTDTGANAIGVGIVKNHSATNALYGYFEVGSGSQNRITIAKVVAGTFTILQQTAISSLPSGINGIAASYDGNSFTIWIQVNSSTGWYPVLNQSITDFNLLSSTELAQWHPYFTVTGGITTPWTITRIRTGYSGATFSRDYRVVTNKDGTPYVSNGYMYFTATTAYCSIFRLNVKNGKFEKCGALMFNRSGTQYFDLNAHIIWDQDINQWRVMWATWGNNSFTAVKLFLTTYDGDILNGVHVVSGGAQMAVSQASGTNAVYDACLVYNYTTNLWTLAYAYSPSGAFGGNMRTVVDTSPDLTTWTNSWIDNTHLNNEGAWICKIGGNFFVFAGDGTNFNTWTIGGTYEGTISLDVAPGTMGNPPAHFIVFPWLDADTTQYYALSWTNVQFQVLGTGIGTFGNGSALLYKANQTELGFEFNAIGVT